MNLFLRIELVKGFAKDLKSVKSAVYMHTLIIDNGLVCVYVCLLRNIQSTDRKWSINAAPHSHLLNFYWFIERRGHFVNQMIYLRAHNGSYLESIPSLCG